MNKKELSEKWSKYCNTDKLVDDAIALLKSNRHAATEKGVCSLLDTYFTNKEPLIKMFMTSKSYIGDMRIALEKDFDRNVDGREIRNFFGSAYNRLYTYEIYKYANNDGKTMYDCLTTGKQTFSIDSLPDEAQQEKMLSVLRQFDLNTGATIASQNDYSDFSEYLSFFYNQANSTLTRDFQHNKDRDNPLLKRGTKTSRAFNKVCAHFGVDKLHPETVTAEDGTQKTKYPYDKVFAEYSDLVSGLVRKMKFVISLNPLDYLTMSNGVNWVSCHNISSGGCMGGTLSYMLDKVSIITFVVENLDGEIHKIPKVYRQMYY